MMDIIKIFGTNVKLYRQRQNISQEKLAEKSGLHRTYISDIERFKRSISLENIQKIAIALNLKPHVLLMEEEDLNGN